MSLTRVLIAVALAALLALVAVIFLRSAGEEASENLPSFAFDPARAVELSVRYPGRPAEGQTERLVRTQGASWDVHWTDPDGTPGRWPAAPSRMRAALRILSTLEMAPAERGTRIEPSGAVGAELRIVLDDGEERLLRLGGRALAGRVLAEIGPADRPHPVWLDRGIMELLIGEPGAAGPRAWRDPSALPGVGADVSRLTLEGSAGVLAIGRIQGRWALRQPVQEFAEPDAIARLFSSLANARIIDYLDGGSDSGRTGLAPGESPTALLTLDSDLRDGAAGAPVSVLRRTLAVGRTADLAGRNIFAHVRQELQQGEQITIDFERTVIISGEQLAAIAMDPAAYVARRTFMSPASDVGSIVLRIDSQERRYERTLDGWRRLTEDGPAPLPKSEAEGLAALLYLVMESPAARITLDEEPAETLAQIEIASLGGNPIGEAAIVAVGETLATYARGILRTHEAPTAQPAANWLRNP